MKQRLRILCILACALFLCGCSSLPEQAPSALQKLEQVESGEPLSSGEHPAVVEPEHYMHYATPLPRQVSEEAVPALEAVQPEPTQKSVPAAALELTLVVGEADGSVLPDTLQQTLHAFAEPYLPGASQATCVVTHRSDTLVSGYLELTLYDDPKNSALLPYTIALENNQQLLLSDFFTAEDTGWRNLLPDLVTASASRQDMMLLCDVPPVEDLRPFYIQDGVLVLLYRPYEITTYEAVWPRFPLPMDALHEYLSGAYGIGVPATNAYATPTPELELREEELDLNE